MKKLLFIAVMLFAVGTARAQSNSSEIDTLQTNSKYAKGKVVLPEDIAKGMVIERLVINKQDVIKVTFKRRLTETEIELVKTYMAHYYERPYPKLRKYNTSAPDINNKRWRCIMIFYSL